MGAAAEGQTLSTGGARLLRGLARPRWLVTRFARLQAAVLKASRGRIRRSRVLAGGQPVLALTTTGRRTGTRRSTVVAYLDHGDAFAVFGVNLGNERDPAWCHNLEANPDTEIDVEGRRLRVRARRAVGPEARELWSRYARRLPAVESFRAISGREIPVYVLEPGPAAAD
jgi:F420H(2)-dependent quinone reductase